MPNCSHSAEVPVVTRHRADELDRLRHPGRNRVDRALEQAEDESVVHDRQARVVAGDQLVDRHVEQRREDRPGARAALAGRRSCDNRCRLRPHRCPPRQREQLVGQVELRRRRLTPGHVELQSAADQCVVGLHQLGVQVGEFLGGSARTGPWQQISLSRRGAWAGVSVVGPSPRSRLADRRTHASAQRRRRLGSQCAVRAEAYLAVGHLDLTQDEHRGQVPLQGDRGGPVGEVDHQ